MDSSKLRNVAGAFATGITVITTNKVDGDMHGMTANSFLSLSLDPALVSFTVRNEGSLLQHIEVGKQVGISILAEDQEPISNQFAGRNKDNPIEVDYLEHSDGTKTIKDSLAWYVTEVKELVAVGDHQLIVCKVLELDRTEGKKPILYFSGYKTMA